MKVVIIGTGNVATVLGKKILSGNHPIVQLVGRNMLKTKELASSLNSIACNNVKEINRYADLYIIAVADKYIADIASQLQLKDQLIVHTAGGVNMEILRNSSNNYGILYPLQSLRKEMEVLPEIPVIVDGNSQLVIEQLMNFATSWAKSVEFCNDQQRLKLHVAAVITSNFTNHLYALAEMYCKSEGLNFNTLLPLINETSTRIINASPTQLQTGPAARGDFETIKKHKIILERYPSIDKIYEVLTASILDFNKSKAV